MNGINLFRILLGGLAAGVIINLGEFLMWGVVLDSAYESGMAARGLTEASWAMGGYVATSLVLGLLLAWLYAAIRPRFGAGPRTALIAGATLWVAAWAVPAIWTAAIGVSFGANVTAISLAGALVEVSVAAMVAARIYQEEEPARVASPGY
jgi:hypothetical protein